MICYIYYVNIFMMCYILSNNSLWHVIHKIRIKCYVLYIMLGFIMLCYHIIFGCFMRQIFFSSPGCCCVNVFYVKNEDRGEICAFTTWHLLTSWENYLRLLGCHLRLLLELSLEVITCGWNLRFSSEVVTRGCYLRLLLGVIIWGYQY